jgi:ketosteroid isomerase-like protein
MLVGSVAGVLLLAPRLAGAGTGNDGRDDAQMRADAMRVEHAIAVAYNDKKWEDLRTLYADDALGLPPNHDPVHGGDAWVAYLRGARDLVGPLDEASFQPVHVSVTDGRVAHVVGEFTMQSGRVRMVYTGLYERRADGSVVLAVDQFGFRDAAG